MFICLSLVTLLSETYLLLWLVDLFNCFKYFRNNGLLLGQQQEHLRIKCNDVQVLVLNHNVKKTVDLLISHT